MSTQEFDDYIRHAGDHGRFTLEGDWEAANTAYDSLQRTVQTIVKSGEGDALFRLYEHSDPWVQSWAASHTLEIDQSRALTKLKQLENAEIPHVSTSAKYTIEEWKSGRLRFLLS